MTLALRMIAGAIAAMAMAAPAAAEHLEPRNACTSMAGADEFRMTLVTAVANRDPDMLQTVIDPGILLDFGGGSGWEEMRARLDAADYRLWDELDTVIRLGCDRAYQDSLVMPYYWGQDFGDMDAYGTYIVLGADVPMFATAKSERRIARLRWKRSKRSVTSTRPKAIARHPCGKCRRATASAALSIARCCARWSIIA